MNDFLAMNGYGAYIWSAYGISAVSIFYFLIQSHQTLKKIKNNTRKGSQNVT